MVQLQFDFSNKKPLDYNKYFRSLEPMVHKFVNHFYLSKKLIDPSLTKDDLIQIAWMYVCEAVNQYDASRGAKLSTFVFLKLRTKFSNLARKQVTHAKKKFMQEDDSFYFIKNGNVAHNEAKISISDSLLDKLWYQSENIALSANITQFVDSLTVNEKRLTSGYFLRGKTMKEMMRKKTKKKAKKFKNTLDNIRSKATLCLT